MLGAGPGVSPCGSCGQVDPAFPGALGVDRRNQHVGPEQELVLYFPGHLIVREVHEQRAHRRQAGLVRHPHLVHDVRPEPLAQEQQAADDLVLLVTEGPDLVRRPGLLGADHRAGLADPVQPEHRAEHPELEPAHDQLAERRIAQVAVLEPADVGGPPRDAGQADVEAAGDLTAQVLEGRVDIAGPHQRAVALAAGPRRTAEAENLLLTFGPHSFVEALDVQHRVDGADLGAGAEVVAQVLRLLRDQLGLAGVQPPRLDAVAVVVLPDLRPDVGPGLRVGGVVEGHRDPAAGAPVPDPHLAIHAPLVVDQQAELRHLGVVLAGRVDRGPDRDHQLHAELVQLLDHGLGVGPLLGVELPVPLQRPVEVVDDDHRQRQPAPLVLARDAEQLILGLVAQLALPEAGRPLRQHRRAAGRLAVLAQDARGSGCGRDPVVPLPAGFGDPPGDGPAQLDTADAGVVPQQAVAPAGDQERDRHLGVALRQLDDGALLVEPAVLVLAQAVEALVVMRLEQHLEVVGAAAVGLVAPGRRAGEVRGGLGQQLDAVRAQEVQLAGRGDLGHQPAVGDPASLGGNLDTGRAVARRRLVEKGPRQILADALPYRAPDPQAVRAPGLDPDDLVPALPLQSRTALRADTHRSSLPNETSPVRDHCRTQRFSYR